MIYRTICRPVMKVCAVIGFVCFLSSCASVASNEKIQEVTDDGIPQKWENTFSMGYQVGIVIHASSEKVWSILTNAKEYPSWNSTVIGITGNIEKNNEIVLRSKVAPDRDFELKVSRFTPYENMVWQDGTSGIFKGVRTYRLIDQGNGSTKFVMIENFAGMMLPMIKGSLPDFSDSFRDFASDLKKKAERTKAN